MKADQKQKQATAINVMERSDKPNFDPEVGPDLAWHRRRTPDAPLFIIYCRATYRRVDQDHRGHPKAEGVKLCISSEGDLSFVDLRAKASRLLDCRQVLHQK